MSIDEYAGGPGRGAASLLFRNRDEDFPEWAGRDIATRAPDARFLLLATDGATSTEVRYAQVPRLKGLDVRPSLATLTIGGNDLLQAFGSGGAARAALRAVRENGHALLTDLRPLLAPGAPLVIGTVHDPSDGTGETDRLGIPPWPGALGWIARLNETLRALAAEHGALVADLHGHFLGHGLRAGNPAQRDARPRERGLWYCGVIEPNAWGAGEIRAVFWDVLEAAGAWRQ